jgi:hypothetical protein
VEGQTLDKLIPPQPNIFLQEKVVADWALQLCDILEYLHSLTPPVIYRDLKPQNIMRDIEGRIRLIDFGIARNLKDDKSCDTALLGSICTASPEHFGTAQTDERSDIYTLGATLHFLLTNGKGAGAQMFTYTSVRSVNPKISETLDGIIRKATEYEPANRYGSIRELRRDLQPCLTPESQAAPQTPGLRIALPVKSDTPKEMRKEAPGEKIVTVAPEEKKTGGERRPDLSAEAAKANVTAEMRGRKRLVPVAIVAGFLIFVILTAGAVVIAMRFFAGPGGPIPGSPPQPPSVPGSLPQHPAPPAGLEDSLLGSRPPGPPVPGGPGISKQSMKGSSCEIAISDTASGYKVRVPKGYAQFEGTPPGIRVFTRLDSSTPLGAVALHLEARSAEGRTLKEIAGAIEERYAVKASRTKHHGADAIRITYREGPRREDIIELIEKNRLYIVKVIAPESAYSRIGDEFEKFFDSFALTANESPVK